MSIDRGNFSPNYAIGMIHGAYAVAYPPRGGSHYHQPYAHLWTYRRGFARGYRLARGLQPLLRTDTAGRRQRAHGLREHDRTSGRMCWCWMTHAPVNRSVSPKEA